MKPGQYVFVTPRTILSNSFSWFWTKQLTGPPQGNCRLHKVTCEYRQREGLQSRSTNSPTSERRDTHVNLEQACSYYSAPLLPFSRETCARRLQELRLLQIFTSRICPTLPASYQQEAREIWSRDIPFLALEYEPLLNVVMALSAIYLVDGRDVTTSYGALDPVQLQVDAAHYLILALQGFHQALNNLQVHMAEAATFTSMLLALHSFASRPEQRQAGIYLPPTRWLQMCNGAMIVVTASLTLLGNDSGAMTVNRLFGSKLRFPRASPAPVCTPSEKFCHIFEYGVASDRDEREDRIVYETVVSHISELWENAEAGEKEGKLYAQVCMSPMFWPDRYTKLVDCRSPRALVILAHYFAIASRCSSIWWIGGRPCAEVYAISEYLGADWQPAMAWPILMMDASC